jgi:hypothetical protein
MKQTKSGNRVVVITGTPPASKKPGFRQPAKQRPTTHRIVVIRNNETVGGRPGR